MHILVCDDDAAFSAKVAEYAATYFEAHEIPVQATVCSDPEQVLAIPDLELYRIAFLDVDMPQVNGIALGGQLRRRNPDICLVYVSAYLAFALDGYKVNAYRYILKRDVAKQLPSCLEDIYASMMQAGTKTLTVHHNRENIRIPLDQIYYLESEGRVINVYGDIAREHFCTFYGKLKELPPILARNGFLQVGRSDVVNLQHVCAIRNYRVLMKNGVELSVSRSKYAAVRAAYLGRGRRFRHPCVWAALLALAVLTLSVLCGFGFFNIKSVVSNIIYLLVIALLFGGTAVDRMSACIINGILCLLTENTVSFVFARLHGICPGEVWHYRTCLAALVISILLVGILVARFLCRWNHCSALDPLQALLMSFFPGVVVLLNIFIMISSNRRVPTLLDLMLTVGLTIAVLVHLAIVQMFNDQVVQGQASHFQAALEQQRAEALMESYTAQRRLTHEFTNHIAALDALLRQGDLTGAQEYLSSVSKVVAAGTTILDTHNPLLDSLLSRKYEEAAQQGVELYFDLCDLKDLPFCGTDLVIVISNLLDNAIRAAAQAKPPEVYLRARRNEEEYLISVRNRVQKDLELVDGELPRSTKAEPGHGMGLVNVREVLDRCRCEYTLSCRDRWFRFTCAVPTRKL